MEAYHKSLRTQYPEFLGALHPDAVYRAEGLNTAICKNQADAPLPESERCSVSGDPAVNRYPTRKQNFPEHSQGGYVNKGRPR
jgi:hypothetical protein